jgi:hypothetical protein
MNSRTLAYIGGAALLLYLLSQSSSAGAANSTIVDLSQFDNSYGADNVQDLQNLLNVLAVNGLTPLQIKMMLSQALQETGLFTNVTNYTAVGNNNFAGISNSDGSLKTYPDIQTFVNEWINILSSRNDPLDATNISDFNTRLYANGYYTDSPTTYGNNLTAYFNLLS